MWSAKRVGLKTCGDVLARSVYSGNKITAVQRRSNPRINRRADNNYQNQTHVMDADEAHTVNDVLDCRTFPRRQLRSVFDYPDGTEAHTRIRRDDDRIICVSVAKTGVNLCGDAYPRYAPSLYCALQQGGNVVFHDMVHASLRLAHNSEHAHLILAIACRREHRPCGLGFYSLRHPAIVCCAVSNVSSNMLNLANGDRSLGVCVCARACDLRLGCDLQLGGTRGVREWTSETNMGLGNQDTGGYRYSRVRIWDSEHRTCRWSGWCSFL